MSEDCPDSAEAFALLRGNGQPWLFVMQAVEIAASPDMLRDLMRWTVYGDTPPRPLPPRPPTQQWMPMYRGHRSMQDGIARGMGLPLELSASHELDELRAISRMSRDEIAMEVSELSRKEQEDIFRPFIGVPFPPDDAALLAILNAIDAEAEPGGTDDESMIDALMSSPAGQFYCRVWWPSWVLYREYAPNLLRSARLGDLDALDRLLRLDKYILHDPGIARVVGDVMSSGRACDKTRIVNAMKGRPTVKLTEANIRAGLGALISQFAYLFHTKVTAPEIQALFDGIERVRSGAQVDPQIAAAGDAWSKAIQRAKTWPSLPTSPPGQ